jgi:transposase
MQFVEGLSDRQTADAVRSRIDWKYALSLELTDPGGDASVLRKFRARLVKDAVGPALLEAILSRFKERGLHEALQNGRAQQETNAWRN